MSARKPVARASADRGARADVGVAPGTAAGTLAAGTLAAGTPAAGTPAAGKPSASASAGTGSGAGSTGSMNDRAGDAAACSARELTRPNQTEAALLAAIAPT